MVFTSTTSPLKRRKRFSRCCPGMRHSPRHKKIAILVRIFQRHKTSAPTFVDRRLHIHSVLDQRILKLIDVVNADEEVHAAAASQHSLEILRERDSQIAATQPRHRRLRVVIDRLDFHPEYAVVKSNRLFQAVDFEKEQIQTTNHLKHSSTGRARN